MLHGRGGLTSQRPDECFVFIPDEQGLQVVQQLVLPFGGTGSVGAYPRIADIICFLTAVLVFLLASHFVDDFYYSEPSRTAQSGFNSLCSIQSVLGFTMKESKSQKPSQTSTLLELCGNFSATRSLPDPARAESRNLIS